MEMICQYAGVNSHVSAGLGTQWAGQLMNSQHHSAESIKQLAAPLGSTPRHRPLAQTTRWHRWGETKQRRASLCTERDPFQKPFMQQIGEIWPMQHSGFALLLAGALRHSKWNQIYGSLKVVKIIHTLYNRGKKKKNLLTNNSLGTTCSFLRDLQSNERFHVFTTLLHLAQWRAQRVLKES